MNTPNAVRKCIPEIIQAAALVHQKHPEVKFIIAGEQASYYPTALSLVESLGGSDYIKFPGVISKETKIDLMQRCKIFLQPTRTEGFGVAILEAMSCGAPVVSSAVGTVPEVAGNAVAFVNSNTPAEIAKKVVEIIEDEKMRKTLSYDARKRAETYAPERRRNDIQKIIKDITK
jgi:glycosyltransferase involved in cell wall biosynthesis